MTTGKTCEKCPLHQHAKSVCMPGKGNPNAGLFFVFDRPSFIEDEKDMPFIGQASRLFVSILEKAELSIDDDYYMTYAFKCAISDESKAFKNESIKSCPDVWLKKEILKFRPKVVVAIGNDVMHAFLPEKIGILKHRGSFFDTSIEVEGEKHEFKVIPTLSPAYLLQNNRELEVQVLSDIKRAKDAVKNGVSCWNPSKVKDLNYKYITEVAGFKDLWKEIKEKKTFGCDIETRELNPYKLSRNDGKFPLVSIQFSTSPGTAWFLPIAHSTCHVNENGFAWTESEWGVIKEGLTDILTNPEYFLIGHNFKFDSKWIYKSLGIKPLLKFDTMLAHGLFGETSNSLKKLAWELTDLGGYEEEQAKYTASLPKEKQWDTFFYPYDQLALYGCCDADVTYRVFLSISSRLSKEPKLSSIFKMLMNASRAFFDIEHDGIKINREQLELLDVELNLEIKKAVEDFRLQSPKEIAILEAELTEENGEPTEFNLGSSAHISKLFYDALKFPVDEQFRSKKTGKPSVGKFALDKLKDKEIVKVLLTHRKSSKQKAAFVDSYRELLDANDKLHPEYKLIKFYNEDDDKEQGAATGRLAAANPNVQQIPAKDETKRIKKLFIPDYPEHVFADCDYSGIELRITAMHANEPRMKEFFSSGKGDFHTWSAAHLLGKKEEDVTKLERSYAKNCVFCVLYGGGPGKIAQQIGCSVAEATNFIKDYFKFFPALQKWLNAQKAFAQKNLYVESKFGRIRQLPDARSKNEVLREAALRKAVNSVIQSDASDLTLYGLTKIHSFLSNMCHFDMSKPSKLRGSVHDSILLSVHKKDFDTIYPVVKFNILENPDIDFVQSSGVKLQCSVSIGPNWGTQTTVDDLE